MAERIKNMAGGVGQGPDIITTVPKAENVGVKSPIPGVSPKLFNTLNQRHSLEFIQEQRLKYPTHEAFLEGAEKEAEHIRLTTREQVMANAVLPDEERLQEAEKLLGPLSDIQKTTLKRMHAVGLDEPGKDEKHPVGVYNYTQRQIIEKARIGAKKTETGEEVFSKEERRKLFDEGLAGFLPATDFAVLRRRISTNPFTDPRLGRIAGKIIATGDAGRADEKFLYETYALVKKLDGEAEVDAVEAQDISTELESLLGKADDDPLLPYVARMRMEAQAQAQRNEDSGYSMIRARYEYYKSIDKASLPSALQVELQNRIESSGKEFQDAMEGYAFWDRSWGRIVLTGRTPEEVIKGVDNYLQIATAEDSNFDASRYLQDADGLNQEIQRVGQQAGMDREEILEQVARAEGTLLINVADHFAVRWHVPEWHKVASIIGTHIDTRLNAVSKAYDAEVMHAAYILDNDEEYDKYSRQAEFLSEESATNDQAANTERVQIRRRLEVRIALSQLKDIDTVIREHFAGIETQIDSFGFDRSDPVSATELFKNPQYLAGIEEIDNRLKDLNQKYAQGLPVTAADKLTDQEKQLLALDRISKCKRTEDLVVIDQADEQFKDLYIEYGGFGTKAGYDAEIARLQGLASPTDKDKRFLERDKILKRLEKGDKLTDEEIRSFPEISRAQQAVDLAIKTREVFFISAEKACVSLITRHNTIEGQGELLSYNDVVRLNKFVRERAIASLPSNVAQAITSSTRNGAGLMYVDIADRLEFINLSQKVLKEKGGKDPFGQNAKEALKLITLTEEEKLYSNHVQAVEDVQEEVLKELKKKGSSLTVSDIDTIIRGKISGAVLSDTESVHKGEANIRKTITYRDIVNREDADPQYNFSMMDDQKYSSLLLSDENKAAAYNSDHPYYYSIPATVRRVLDPDQSKLVHTGDPDVDRAAAFKVQETQRRFHFAVDSVKVFGAFYNPDLYKAESDEPTVAEMVINIRNAPFIGRRMIEQRAWTLWNRGQAYRGRGFLKYLESNFRGLDHSVGRRGLRGVTASYNGFSAKGFDYALNFSGALDELKAELWLGQGKAADEIRSVLVGGQVGQESNFEGIFKKVVKTIGRNNIEIASAVRGELGPALWSISQNKQDDLKAGDYEKAITEIEDRWGRVTIYGNSLGFVGNTSQVPLSAKFSGDTAVRRLVYWAVAHPEAESTYSINRDLTRVILQPLKEIINTNTGKQGYFGKGATLLSELQRRAILQK